MKLRLTFAFLIITIGLTAQNEKFQYKFDIEGLTDSVAFMGNYYGGKMYYNDTALVSKNGQIIFEGEGKKEGGIYALILEDKKTYFEFIVNEPKVHITTTRKNLTKDLKVKESEENKAYYEYINYISNAQQEVKAIQADLKKEGISDKEKEKLNSILTEKKNTVDQFKVDYLKRHDGLFAAKLLRTYKEPEVPESITDQTERYLYFRDHFFDGIDMKDDRLLRTPVLNKKIEFYLEKLTVQNPDSIFIAIKRMLDLSNDDGLIYKYVVQYSTNTYEKSQVMGMDAVFVHVAKEVYAQNKDWWLDTLKHKEIVEQYELRRNLIIGKQAEEIKLLTPDSSWASLYDIKKKYTILFFWDPNCGHCKKEIPKLKKFYDEWKTKNVEVFAVSTDFENDDWMKFIKEKEIGEWINVSDNPEVNQNAFKYIKEGKTTLKSLNFRDHWDIFSTPQVYVLDADKKIIAKRIMSEQLPEFLNNYNKMKEEQNGSSSLERKSGN